MAYAVARPRRRADDEARSAMRRDRLPHERRIGPVRSPCRRHREVTKTRVPGEGGGRHAMTRSLQPRRSRSRRPDRRARSSSSRGDALVDHVGLLKEQLPRATWPDDAMMRASPWTLAVRQVARPSPARPGSQRMDQQEEGMTSSEPTTNTSRAARSAESSRTHGGNDGASGKDHGRQLGEAQIADRQEIPMNSVTMVRHSARTVDDAEAPQNFPKRSKISHQPHSGVRSKPEDHLLVT